MSSRRLARPEGLPSGPKARSAHFRDQNTQFLAPQPREMPQARSQRPSIGRPTPRDDAHFSPSSDSSRSRMGTVSPSSSDGSSLFDVRGSRRPDSGSSITSADEDVMEKSDDVVPDEPVPEEKRLWNTVASVAGVLTVSVSKAWATNIATQSGEETPPGQESRITRALKAYHIEKARDPSELPEWLFEPHERRPGRHRHQGEEDVSHTGKDPALQPGNVGRAAASSKPSQHFAPTSHPDETYPPSNAADRLKAFRNAKRSAHVTSHQQHEEESAPLGFERPSRQNNHRQDGGQRHHETFARRKQPQRSLPSSVRLR